MNDENIISGRRNRNNIHYYTTIIMHIALEDSK